MAFIPDRLLLRHYLASIAYHTQKAIRGAPEDYWMFSPGNQVRTPQAILRHMTSVLGYARTFITGGTYGPEPLPDSQAEIERFHKVLGDLSRLLDNGSPLQGINELQLLQGPFSDVMTHIGQLSLLRRLCGSPVPPENFIYADISAGRLGRDQAAPRSPDADWPERGGLQMGGGTASAEVAVAFVHAINCRDVDALCRLMTDDHLFVDSGGAQCQGREAMRVAWLGYFSIVPDYRIDVLETVADGQIVFLTGTASGTYSPDGSLNPVDRWSTPGAWRSVVKNAHIAVWQVYADNEPIRQIMRRHGRETA